MKSCFVFLAPGFEEIEALATVDILRRGGLKVTTVAVNDSAQVTGAHGVPVVADAMLHDVKDAVADWMVLPGGLPGAQNLADSLTLTAMLKAQHTASRGIAAICASPAFVLAPLGIIEGRKATCYPGCEPAAQGKAAFSAEPVEVDGNVVTGKGPGYTFDFALTVLRQAVGQDAAAQVSAAMLP